MQTQSRSSHVTCLLAIFLGGAGMGNATPYTETSAYVGANTTNDYKTSSTGAPLISSRSRPGSSITTTATPGAMTVHASAAGGSDTTGIAHGSASAQDTYTITGGSGAGTATFTFYVNGSLVASRTSGSTATYDVSFDYNMAISGRSDQYGDSGSHPPQKLVFTRGFTYGVPFDLHASIGGYLTMPNGSNGSANLALRCAGYSVNGASSYTGGSSAGATRGTLLAPGAAYDGFLLANIKNHQSTLTLCDGDAGAQRELAVNFMPPAPDLETASDIVDVKGTGTDLVVIQLSYNEALFNSFGWTSAMLGWFDPATQLWKNAVAGNSGGNSMFKNGPYDPATDSMLGKFGIDRPGKVVWAVVNHNSQFAVLEGEQPALPTDYGSWKMQNFTVAEQAVTAISGPDANPDGDGLSNFEEYAFFADPGSFSPNPVASSTPKYGQYLTYLTMTYKRRKGVTDLAFDPQFSSDIAYWNTGFHVSTVDNLDGSETVTARDNTPTQDLAGRRFARIRVSP